VIPLVGGSSKDFITVFLPAILHISRNSLSDSRDYCVIPLVGRQFKGFYHRLKDGVISFSLKTLFRQA
jgi:hypothetical protein